MFLDKALTLARSIGDANQQSAVLNCRGQIKWNTGDLSTAQSDVHESQRLARVTANFYHEAQAMEIESTCCVLRGDYRTGMSLLQAARQLVQLYGVSGGSLERNIMRSLAQVHMFKSEYAEARHIHSELMHSISAEQDPYSFATSLLNIAEVDVKTGAAGQDVRAAVDRARAFYSALGYHTGAICCDLILADFYLMEGDLSAAKSGFDESIRSCRGTITEVVSYSLERFADRKFWIAGKWPATWPVVYFAFANSTRENLAVNKALCFMGDVFVLDEDDDTAGSLFTLALDGFTAMGVHENMAQCKLRLGDLAYERGDLAKAAEHWREARPLFERSSQAKYVTKIDVKLGTIGLGSIEL
ncbi:hypothetical protein DFH06DRAFT_690026 [Mycena polygramma]|nr:hypothetical protein DFH06DRAFT_690026 [Mycena polygramma]